MRSRRVTLVAIIFAVYQTSRVESFGLVEMISDYAKVVKNTEKPTTSAAENQSIATTPSPLKEAEPAFDYQDFDDLQEEEDRSLKQPSSSETMLKYFNGLVSLLALMAKFNGSSSGNKPPRRQIKNENEPRKKSIGEEVNKLQDTGKHFHEAQDRFEFPQKKFRWNHENQVQDNIIDQQYHPVENYPPYNPLKANSAETYNQDDKKTSYEADLSQYDLTKNSLGDHSMDVDIQQSYSYEIPYENPKQVKGPTYDITNDGGASWGNQDIHPVYHPWMSKTPTENKPANVDNSYQVYQTKLPTEDKPTHHEDTYNPWKNKIPETKLQDSDGRQPWAKPGDKPLDFPIYHHDFKDPPPSDHHFEYHEIDHAVDEDRVSKKPYSYYFLGRKLWYVPLLFSVYFIIYIGALVLKSVARHKIQFPEKIWNLHDEHFAHGKHRRHRKVNDVTENYENALEKMKNKFM